LPIGSFCFSENAEKDYPSILTFLELRCAKVVIDNFSYWFMIRKKFSFIVPTNSQIDKCADITADLGLIFVASVVLPAVLGQPRFWPIIVGIALAVIFWTVSFWLLSLKQ
jgi:hypothetical protein